MEIGLDSLGIRSCVVAVLLSLSLLLMGCFQPNAGITFSQKRQSTKTLEDHLFASDASLGNSAHRSIERYGDLIRRHAIEYELDWRLVLAIIRQESSFRATAVSHKGAYGLMQLMPVTQMELIEKLGVPEAQSPHFNIQAGMYHLRSLYRYFSDAKREDRLKLSLAAYNAGLGRILDAQEIARYLGKDPNSWDTIRRTLPLLSKKYATLHERVWRARNPRSGPFGSSQETIHYVASVTRYYEEYQRVL